MQIKLAERMMMWVRWLAVPFVLIQVLLIDASSEVMVLALGLTALFTICNLCLLFNLKHKQIMAMALETFIIYSFMALYAHESFSEAYLAMYLLVLAATIRFGKGLLMMMINSVYYIGLQLWAQEAYSTEFIPAEISFRLGMGFLIAALASVLASSWRRSQEDLNLAYEQEKNTSQKLREADRFKGRFLNTIVHDLKTPLSVIQAHAKLMTEKEHAKKIETEARHIERMLKDVVEVINIQQGQVPANPVRINLYLSTAKTIERITALGCRQQINNHAPDLDITMDRSHYERIIDNLITNACKYATIGKVNVYVSVESEWLKIRVEDEGEGIKEDLREIIFDVFERGDKHLSKTPGNGLGLAFVRQLARLNEGDAWVEDREDGRSGSAFCVEIKLSDS